MVIWQLTVDAVDPERMAAFWGPPLGYVFEPAPEGFASWLAWYRAAGVPAEELADLPEDFCDRLVDPAGQGPKIWFQLVQELPAARHRFHFDVYVAPRTGASDERIALVEARVAELEAAGGTVQDRFDERPARYHVTMLDPEGNIFCVA